MPFMLRGSALACLLALAAPPAAVLNAEEDREAEIEIARGELALERGDYARAEACFARARGIRPGDPHILRGLGVALNRLGNYDGASRALGGAARIAPNLPGLDRERGYALAGEGKHGEALLFLDRALSARPDDGLAEYLKGRCLAVAGDHAGAMDCYSRAARDPSLAPAAEYQSALSEAALGRGADARARIARLIREEPSGSTVSLAARGLLGEPAKRWWVYTTARYEYDSNVVLLPNDEALVDESRKDDFRFMNTFELKVSPVVRERYDLSVDYRFVQSVHNQIGDFNLQGHELAPTLTFSLADGVSAYGGYEFDYFALDDWHQDYYRTHALFSGIDYAATRHLLSRLSYRFTTGDYFLDHLSPDDNLDILNEHTIGLDQYLFLGGDRARFFRFSLSYDRNDTAGRNFFYNGYSFLWEFSTPVAEEVRLDAWARFLVMDFDRSTTGRRDRRQEYNVMLLRPLNGYLDVAFNYGAMLNGSNVPLYEFDRNIFSLIVACHF